MSDAAGQRAMLNFVEILMNSSGPLTISQLAGHFGSRNFDAEMRTAAGGNETGLKKLLLKYPSLFTVKGNLVSLYNHDEEEHVRTQSPFSDVSEHSLPDVSAEMEAVRYFQNKFARKHERWMPIASLAGHLSQASREIRNVVGPQLQFRNWLLKHPHIFELCDNLVGLQEDIAAVVLDAEQSYDDNISKYCTKKQQYDIWKLSISNGNRSLEDGLPFSPVRRRTRVERMDSKYATLFYLVDLVEKNELLTVEGLCEHLNVEAPGTVQNVLNDVGIHKFLLEHSAVFTIDNGYVKLNENKQTKDNGESGTVEEAMIKEGSGTIYHVAKLWGIIDLGQHEHVFFDRSILESDLADLQAEYKVGETLHFRALAAPKRSRAKWRAVKIWRPSTEPEDMNKVSKDQPELAENEEITTILSSLSAAHDEEVACLTETKDEDEEEDGPVESPDESLLKESSSEQLEKKADVAEEGFDDATLENHSNLLESGMQDDYHKDIPDAKQVVKYVSVACQTLSTGDIIATSLYQSF